MQKLIKFQIASIAVLLLVFVGCDALFDTGDTEKSYDGPAQVEFFPLEQQLQGRLAPDPPDVDSGAVRIQLIAPQRNTDLSVSFFVDETESSAIEGEHFTISDSPVVIAANTSVSPDIEIIPLWENHEIGEVVLILEIEGTDADDVTPADNLKRATIFMQRVN